MKNEKNILQYLKLKVNIERYFVNITCTERIVKNFI